MPRNRESGLKARDTNLKNNPNYYAEIALESQKAWKRNGRKPRGIAALSKEKRREIALKGVAARLKKSS